MNFLEPEEIPDVYEMFFSFFEYLDLLRQLLILRHKHIKTENRTNIATDTKLVFNEMLIFTN